MGKLLSIKIYIILNCIKYNILNNNEVIKNNLNRYKSCIILPNSNSYTSKKKICINKLYKNNSFIQEKFKKLIDIIIQKINPILKNKNFNEKIKIIIRINYKKKT